MRGDLRTATMREFDDGPHVFCRPGRLLSLRSVEVELEEVHSILELRRCGLPEGRAIIRFEREATRENAAVADPGSGDADPRPSKVRSPPFSYAEREGPPPAVSRIHGEGRPDIAGPTHTRLVQQISVVLRDLEKFFRRIGPAVDPMRPSGKGEVTVGIDHPRDDRRAASVDDADVGRQRRFVGGRAQPHDAAIGDENAHALP
jgi:hypothetical protein